MFIKEIELTNFKSHTSSFYQFGKTNHFFGDNFAGKSSIREAIVFCLFGMTKHGYKGYAKDYLQSGKTTMKVRVSLLFHDQEYINVRLMNSKGTTTVSINHKDSNERDVKNIIGDYQSFIYCFFPDVFPEENKNTARTFLITELINDGTTFDDFEKAKSRITKQQKNVSSSITFYEGERTILQQQLDSLTGEEILNNSNHSEKKNQLLAEVSQLNHKLEQIMSNRYQLQSKIGNC
jgi:DNA repair exonuclease SbcCD ATPase subunit